MKKKTGRRIKKDVNGNMILTKIYADKLALWNL